MKSKNSVDLGELQNEFVLASRDFKTKAKALTSAESAHDIAKARLANASAKLQSASRAVIADA